MALTGDCYVGRYEGHSIQLIRNNWNKKLKLFIDGAEVASTSCMLPGRFRLTGILVHNGVQHTVVATSVPHRVLWTDDTIEIDGKALPIVYEQPRGLLKAAWRDLAWAILVVILLECLVVLLFVGGKFLIQGLH